MRPDAMASSFFMRTMQQGRMDRAQGGQQSAQAQGSGSGEAASNGGQEGFKAVYVEVAKSNEQAYVVTESTAAAELPEADAGREGAGETLLRALLGPSMTQDPAVPSGEPVDILQILSASQQLPQVPETPFVIEGVSVPGNAAANTLRSAEASALISAALTEIGEALHLSIDPGLKNLSISGNATDLAQQFSEILATLKQIAGVLDDAVAKGQQIDLGKAGIIDVPQARSLSSFVSVRTFRIEIAVSMLGVGDAVQNDLAARMKGMATGGIVQAIDPATVSMPQAHVEKLFGKLFSDSAATLGALVAKVREMAGKNGQAPDAAMALKLSVAATSVTQSVQTSGAPHSALEGQMLRKLLKVDGQEALAAQNAEAAAQAVKVNLQGNGLKAMAIPAVMEALKTADELLPMGEAAGKVSLGHLTGTFEAKSALPSFRGADETVMHQITERLQSAIRSGLTEIRLQLRPESLGEVKMSIRVEHDVVFARIQVESQQVKQIVETSLQSLKESLQQQHLSCGSLEVSVGNEGWEKEEPGLRGGAQHGVTASANAGESELDAPAVALGSETGRRFGDNTIEYFA